MYIDLKLDYYRIKAGKLFQTQKYFLFKIFSAQQLSLSPSTVLGALFAWSQRLTISCASSHVMHIYVYYIFPKIPIRIDLPGISANLNRLLSESLSRSFLEDVKTIHLSFRFFTHPSSNTDLSLA